MIHPAVIEYIRDTIRQNRTRSGILLIETALMYETGCDSLCDEVWLVYVPEEERIRRLASDRGYSEQKSKAIIQSQISETLLREKVQRIVPMMEQKKIWSGHWMRCLQPLIPLH